MHIPAPNPNLLASESIPTETTTPRDEDTANKPRNSIIHGQYGGATAFA
jgi:hypothetical protein